MRRGEFHLAAFFWDLFLIFGVKDARKYRGCIAADVEEQKFTLTKLEFRVIMSNRVSFLLFLSIRFINI